MNAGDRKRIELLYLQMYDMLFAYARSSLKTDALAEELVQETFAIACRKPDALLESRNPQGWLVNTLKYELRKTLDDRKLALKAIEDYLAVYGREALFGIDNIAPEILYEDLSYREEFLLLKEMALDGLSYEEMAQSRGITQATCRKRVQRAREYLRKMMEK